MRRYTHFISFKSLTTLLLTRGTGLLESRCRFWNSKSKIHRTCEWRNLVIQHINLSCLRLHFFVCRTQWCSSSGENKTYVCSPWSSHWAVGECNTSLLLLRSTGTPHRTTGRADARPLAEQVLLSTTVNVWGYKVRYILVSEWANKTCCQRIIIPSSNVLGLTLIIAKAYLLLSGLGSRLLRLTSDCAVLLKVVDGREL